MKHLAAATSLLAAVASAFPSPYRPSYNTRSTNSTRKALYFLQNNETEASIIAMNLQNGQVSNPTRYSTAGAGLSIVNATTDAAIDIDQLQSQGSVAVGGNVSLERASTCRSDLICSSTCSLLTLALTRLPGSTSTLRIQHS